MFPSNLAKAESEEILQPPLINLLYLFEKIHVQQNTKLYFWFLEQINEIYCSPLVVKYLVFAQNKYHQDLQDENLRFFFNKKSSTNFSTRFDLQPKRLETHTMALTTYKIPYETVTTNKNNIDLSVILPILVSYFASYELSKITQNKIRIVQKVLVVRGGAMLAPAKNIIIFVVETIYGMGYIFCFRSIRALKLTIKWFWFFLRLFAKFYYFPVVIFFFIKVQTSLASVILNFFKDPLLGFFAYTIPFGLSIELSKSLRRSEHSEHNKLAVFVAIFPFALTYVLVKDTIFYQEDKEEDKKEEYDELKDKEEYYDKEEQKQKLKDYCKVTKKILQITFWIFFFI